MAATKKTATKTHGKATNAAVKVTQVRSGLGRAPDQRATLVGLGLGKMNRTRVLQDTPSVRGMINKVQHLIKIEQADA